MVDATGYWLEATAAFVAVTVFAIVFGIGECLHGPAHQALVGELGAERLRGRYFALHSMSWGLGGVAGPAIGGLILATAPFALWPLAAAVCLVAAAGAVALERLVPEPLRRIPRAELAHGVVLGELEPEPGRTPRVDCPPMTVHTDDPLSTDAQPASHQALAWPHRCCGGRRTAAHR